MYPGVDEKKKKTDNFRNCQIKGEKNARWKGHFMFLVLVEADIIKPAEMKNNTGLPQKNEEVSKNQTLLRKSYQKGYTTGLSHQ